MTNGAMEKAFEEWWKSEGGQFPTGKTIARADFAAGYHARDAEVAETQKQLEAYKDICNSYSTTIRLLADEGIGKSTRIEELEKEVAELRIEELEKEVAEWRKELTQADGTILRQADEIGKLQDGLERAQIRVRALEQMADDLRKRLKPMSPFSEDKPPDDDPLTMPVERLRECVAREVMGWHKELECTPTGASRCWESEGQIRGGLCVVDWRPDTNPADWQMVKDKMRERGFRYGAGYNAGLPPCWAYFSLTAHVILADAESEGVAGCRAAVMAVRA